MTRGKVYTVISEQRKTLTLFKQTPLFLIYYLKKNKDIVVRTDVSVGIVPALIIIIIIIKYLQDARFSREKSELF